MSQLLEMSRPTVDVETLISHINHQVDRFGPGNNPIPFWTGTVVLDGSSDEQFVSIRMSWRELLLMVHTRELGIGDATLKTNLSDGNEIVVPITVNKCSPFRLNWFQSTALFKSKNVGILKWKTADAARLIRDAKSEQRRSQRMTYHCPAVIIQSDQQVVAYIRDISPKGIGFLHERPVVPGIVAVDVYPGHDDEPLRVHVQLTWCARSADLGYRSGGFFVDVGD